MSLIWLSPLVVNLMIVRISRIWPLACLLVLAQASEPEDYDLVYPVNRIVKLHNEGDLGANDDYDYYMSTLNPIEKAAAEKEPFKRLPRWRQGWRRHPLYVLILGG